METTDSTQPGNTTKAVERIVDVIEGEEMPVRLPLGVDVLEMVRRKYVETLSICEDWEGVVKSTDFVGGV